MVNILQEITCPWCVIGKCLKSSLVKQTLHYYAAISEKKIFLLMFGLIH